VMPPFMEPFGDHLAIQKVAKNIADFIGLGGFTFIIAIAKQKENVAGHIDLATLDKDIFVEVDSNMMTFPDAVAATLCHEVCHKWLQVNGIRSPIDMEIENEILTDITSVFLGFGKVMLNGCRTTSIRTETVPNGTRTVTETMTSGYLDRDQLAFVYRLVCAMRHIPSSEFLRGLNAEAAQAVQICDSSFGHHYDPRFHRRETTHDTVTGLMNQVVGVQYTLGDLDKHVIYVRKSFCETRAGFVRDAHRKLESLRQKALAVTEDTELDPALRFLRAIQRDTELTRVSDDIHSVSREAEGFLEDARGVGRYLFRNSHGSLPPSTAMFTIVTCPQDGTKLHLPEGSGDLIVTCPRCKYRFAYRTNALSFPEAAAPRKRTWWQKMWSLAKRKQER